MCDHVSTSMYNATVTETVGDTAGDNGFPLWLNWLRVPGLAHGLVYGLYGTLIGFVTTAFYLTVQIIRDQIFTECIIPEYSLPDMWIKVWISKTLTQKMGSRLTLQLGNQQRPTGRYRRGSRGMQSVKIGQDGELDKVPVDYLPQENMDIRFWYNGRLCWVNNTSEKGARLDGIGGPPLNRVKITTLLGGRQLITELIQEAQVLYNEELKTKTVIRSAGAAANSRYGEGQHWLEMGARPSRPFDTVVLDPGIAHKLKDDVASFLDSAKWYYSRGVPYRRGYLLHGPPGCGKTSFVTALAGELHLPIYIINLTSTALSDDTLLSLMSQAEDGSILLLEDVDAAFKSSESESSKDTGTNTHSANDINNSNNNNANVHGNASPWKRGVGKARDNADAKGISFSGLLNAIDGVAAQEGKVLIMTTNHVDRLDPALIRPGRIDVRAYIGRISKSGAKSLFLRFYREVGSVSTDRLDELAQAYADKVPDKAYAPALIQGHLMNHKFDPEGACADFETLVKTAEAMAAKGRRTSTDAEHDDDEGSGGGVGGDRDEHGNDNDTDIFRTISGGLNTVTSEIQPLNVSDSVSNPDSDATAEDVPLGTSEGCLLGTPASTNAQLRKRQCVQ